MRSKTIGSLLAAAAIFGTAAIAELNKTRGNGPGDKPELTFVPHRLGTDHAEGVSTIDINGDGRMDLVSGAYWYENPGPGSNEWRRHQYRTIDVDGEFVSDCGEWPIDVNHDGAVDLVTVGWQTDGLFWYENPKKLGAEWKKHLISHTIKTEGGTLGDLNGDGRADLALAHYGRSGVIWVDFSGSEPKVHSAGTAQQDGHGVGIADMDSDGKPDLLTPYGWMRNVDAAGDRWEWHGDWELGEAGFPILGFDVNDDGKMDVIYGRGHSYGLYWLEGKGGNKWQRHTIDESFSQVHALRLIDLDGDGRPELLAGKRYRGHNGNDPGSYDPLAIYYYSFDRKGNFSRHPVTVGSTAGAGTQLLIEDFDGDGDLDIAAAGKTGVHLLENLKIDKVPGAQREKELLLDKQWPFPGEGQGSRSDSLTRGETRARPAHTSDK